MGLSRLDNFLKSARGTILYVNPNDLDATDSIENQGNSLTRPFKTIQRALIEASRFSYQKGLDNDRFGKTTILLYPGEHLVDNRPGYIPTGTNTFLLRNGTTSNDLPPYDLTTNFDLETADNELFKLNSIYGGVIVPRGTSLVGLDLRKTKIRPKYVPSPTNDNIERSALWRITGECYFWQFSMFDANPNGTCYLDYTTNEFVPNFSHHKLTCFEYADGVNAVDINDTFITYSTSRTDLDMYYEKISLVYGQSSGRAIEPDYPSTNIDIQPKVDEYRIVGSTGESTGISSIRAGDGVTPTTSITVSTTTNVAGLDVDTPFRVTGITAAGYNGQYVVSERPDSDVNSWPDVVYSVQNAPTAALPSATGSELTLSSDTVTSSSPYIFNCSLRSVYGMCGMTADGAKATGFKSMVVAQFTGIGLQKDDNAFVVYNTDSPPTGTWDDNTVAGNESLSTNSNAITKPSYRNYHVKVSNKAVIQAVSVFAIGYSQHFLTESGGDISLTNSNSNFGSKALVSEGFRDDSYTQDDYGYITHIIPPKEIPLTETSIEFEALDVGWTVGVGSTAHLYLYGQTNLDSPPENVLEGYRVGAKAEDKLNVLISYAGTVTEYSARITMPDSEYSAEKISNVQRSSAGINSIGSRSDGGVANVLTFTADHSFLEGESVRVIGDTGQLPDGLNPNTLYYAIPVSGYGSNLKLAKTKNEAINGTALTINNKGGVLKVISRVADKNSGDVGHPIQYDVTRSNWYINVASASSGSPATDNTIFSIDSGKGGVVGLGSTALGDATSRTFIKRKSDNRNAVDTTYRARYVIPQDNGGVIARPPSDGYIIQESNTSIGSTDGEIATYFGTGSLGNENQQRNFRFIADARWDSSSNVYVTTELPHNLTEGSQIEMVNVKSSVNLTGIANSSYNQKFTVTGISSARTFVVGLTTDPGTFSNDTSSRTTSLPYFKKKQFSKTYYSYRATESQKYVPGDQDGVYYLTIVNASNSPTTAPFTNENFSQPITELYPQTDRDNPKSDPAAAQCFANNKIIGEVTVNDPKNSITKETLNEWNVDNVIGVGITNITSGTGLAHTITTTLDHGLNRLTSVGIASSGAGYGSGTAGDIYNARLVSIGSSITGKNASVKLTVDGDGGITAVKIMDGGSAYGIGNTMNVVGVGTTTGFVQAVLNVTKIYDNVNDVIRVSGITSEAFAGYNDLYRITGIGTAGIGTDNERTINVASASTITGFTTAGVADECTNAWLYQTGQCNPVSALAYDYTSGIATITTVESHGFGVDKKIRVVGAAQTMYNGGFVITKNISLTQFAVNMGTGTTNPTASGAIKVFREGFTSNDGVITENSENLSGRMDVTYAGITTTLSADILNATTDEINLNNIADYNINIGEYFAIDNEIVRVKTTTNGGSAPTAATNPLYVFRGVLGTRAVSHDASAVIRKIDINPVELRRHSIIRASGHTFEYVGFGPGNYSTAFPSKQNREITFNEELLAQSTKQSGGVNFYTGMNDQGTSFAGNKKLSTLTGKEEIFDTPVQTVTGEDIAGIPGLNVTDATEMNVDRSIKVDGGNDNKVISEFNGPLVVNNKLTVNSTKGVETNNLFLQGDTTVSRKYTVGIATPSLAGNPGDIVFTANPSEGGHAGWLYSIENDWRRFGPISLGKTDSRYVFDRVGIGTTTPGSNTLQVGMASSIFVIQGDGGVGIGTDDAADYALQVYGSTNIVGTCTATKFVGDGSDLSNLSVENAGWTNAKSGLGVTLTYNTSFEAKGLVGIGTSLPTVTLEAGHVGMGSTSLITHGITDLKNQTKLNLANVTGIITASGFDLQSSSGDITAGIITTTNLNVGTSYTTLYTSSNAIGIGTLTVRAGAKLDIEGHARFKTYSENSYATSSSSNVVTLDLATAQTFTLTTSEAINSFTLLNVPDGSTSFTIKILQGSTAYGVGIDTFKNLSGSAIPVYWPGGVIPYVTRTAAKTDVYSFKCFDGSSATSAGIYGVVGGQNYG